MGLSRLSSFAKLATVSIGTFVLSWIVTPFFEHLFYHAVFEWLEERAGFKASQMVIWVVSHIMTFVIAAAVASLSRFI